MSAPGVSGCLRRYSDPPTPQPHRSSVKFAAGPPCGRRVASSKFDGEQPQVELAQALAGQVGLERARGHPGLERLLGELDPRLREARDPLPDLDRRGDHVVVHGRDEADPLGLVGLHVAPGEHQVGGAGRADRARQEEAQPELAGGEPVVDAGRAEVRRGRGDPQVAGERQAEPAADRRAVDRGDHRLVQPADASGRRPRASPSRAARRSAGSRRSRRAGCRRTPGRRRSRTPCRRR